MINSFANKVIEKYGEEYLTTIWSNKNIIDPWKISWKANKKAIFNCDKGHEFERYLYAFWNTDACPICRKISNSLGSVHPECLPLWSNQNTKTPFDFSSMCGDIVLWKCDNGIHSDYRRVIKNSVLSHFKCPQCVDKKPHPNTWNRLELTNQKFGELLVESFAYTKNGATFWKCICSCGDKPIKNGNDLRSGKIMSCGSGIHRLGENNGNWKNGATERNYSERYSKAYSEWHMKVLKRDNYTCQCCGQYSGDLQVHHILDFAHHPDIRTDLKNGITLCANCHDSTIKGSFHNLYGTHGKTPEQLEEYINNKRKQLGIHIPFTIESYRFGNILKPDDINQEDEYPWIFAS